MKLAVAGVGYWGINHVRAFARQKGCTLAALCDPAARVPLGRVRPDGTALWSLAPHDLSMILDLVGARPATVAARGQAYLRPGVEDVVFVNLAFADGKMAQVQLSWLDPRKERRLTV